MIEDRSDTLDLAQEKRIIRRLSLVSILGNVLLSALKIAAGITGRSGAMISDAVHSISDVLTTAIAWIGARISRKRADRSHPYGYERFECAATLALGILLLLTGLGIGVGGIERIIAGDRESIAVPGVIALAAAVLSIAAKEGMFWYTRYYAKKIDSTAFLADAWHHRSDALSSVGSLVGIGGAMLGLPILDTVAGVGISLFVLKVAYDILKDAGTKLMDTACDEDYETALRKLVEDQPEVMGVDLLRTRRFGNKIYVDLGIRVDGGKCLRESHAVLEQVRHCLKAAYPSVKGVMIQLDPA